MLSERILARCLFLVIAGCVVSLAFGNASTLTVDGVVRVKGVPLSGTRVLVLPMDGAPQVITQDVARFSLALQLQTSYLLSFEREGCVTKQLMFDTHVPAGAVGEEPYDFPFQVTLEPPPGGTMFEYAGPVGLIKFDKDIADFGYDTNYKVDRNPAFAERLEALHDQLSAAALPAPSPLAAAPMEVKVETSAPAAVEEPMAKETAFEELVPTRSEEAPLLHSTSRPIEAEGTKMEPAEHVVTRAATHAVAPVPASIAAVNVQEQPAPAEGRTSEVIAEKLKVTTITRIVQEGHVVELRRVASYYGGITYFKDGQACSPTVYSAAVAE